MSELNKKWGEYLTEIDVNPANFEPKYELAPEIWSDDRMEPEIRAKLLKIVDEFLKSFSVDVEFEDIVLTGSIASYHWNKNSDIDIHIIIDYEKIDENNDIMKELFNLKRFQWNKSHEITIHDFEVEIYMQDIEEKHYNLGEFSIFYNKWLKKPTLEKMDIDLALVEKKADQIADEIDEISRLSDDADHREAYKLAKRVAKRLKKMRKTGLEHHGVMAVENLVFKALRNADYLGKLMSLKSNSYDKMMSIDEGKNNKLDFTKIWKSHINV